MKRNMIAFTSDPHTQYSDYNQVSWLVFSLLHHVYWLLFVMPSFLMNTSCFPHFIYPSIAATGSTLCNDHITM